MSDPSANERLLEAAGLGDIGAIRAALADGAGNLDEALFAAAEAGHVAAAGYLIDRGANPKAVRQEYNHGDPFGEDAALGVFVLTDAADAGRLDMVRLLLDRGAGEGPQALQAFWNGSAAAILRADPPEPERDAIVLALLDGLDPRPTGPACYVMAPAAAKGRGDLLRGLLERGIRPLPNKGFTGWAWHRAAGESGRKLVQDLLRETAPEEVLEEPAEAPAPGRPSWIRWFLESAWTGGPPREG